MRLEARGRPTMTSGIRWSMGVLVVAAGLLVASCGTRPGAASAPAPRTMALVGGRVHAAPDAPVIADGVVLVREGLITAVGRRGDVPIPAGADVIDCAGATVTAGFWNSHVHFTQSVWSGAATAPADHL